MSIDQRLQRLEAQTPKDGPLIILFTEPGEPARDAWARERPCEPFPESANLLCVSFMGPTDDLVEQAP